MVAVTTKGWTSVLRGSRAIAFPSLLPCSATTSAGIVNGDAAVNWWNSTPATRASPKGGQPRVLLRCHRVGRCSSGGISVADQAAVEPRRCIG